MGRSTKAYILKAPHRSREFVHEACPSTHHVLSRDAEDGGQPEVGVIAVKYGLR
jgi:hypothetical protein